MLAKTLSNHALDSNNSSRASHRGSATDRVYGSDFAVPRRSAASLHPSNGSYRIYRHTFPSVFVILGTFYILCIVYFNVKYE